MVTPEFLNDLKQKLSHAEAEGDINLPVEVSRLAWALIGSGEPMVNCEGCMDDLPAYVEAEVSGLSVSEVYPQVQAHLDCCPSCSEAYAEILDMVIAAESLPLPRDIPQPDARFLPPISLREFVVGVVQEVLERWAPSTLPDLEIVSDTFFDRITSLGGEFVLSEQVAPALGLGTGEVPESLQILAATYLATHALISSEDGGGFLLPSSDEEESRAMLHSVATNAARTVGLSGEMKTLLIEYYVERMLNDLETLLLLREGKMP